jgi:hypothetical protein
MAQSGKSKPLLGMWHIVKSSGRSIDRLSEARIRLEAFANPSVNNKKSRPP